MNKNEKRSYPKHRYPLLVHSSMPGYPADDPMPLPTSVHPAEEQIVSTPQTKFEWLLLNWLSTGARVLFDMTKGRALLYSFKRGFEELQEISVRMLSQLLKKGLIRCTGKEGTVVHYAWTGGLSK